MHSKLRGKLRSKLQGSLHGSSPSWLSTPELAIVKKLASERRCPRLSLRYATHRTSLAASAHWAAIAMSEKKERGLSRKVRRSARARPRIRGSGVDAGKEKPGPRTHFVRQDVRELLHDVLEDVRRRLLEKGLQGRQVRALLDHRLQSALRLRLQVVAGIGVQVDREEAAEAVGLCQGAGVIRRVTPDLAQRPRRGSLEVILGLVDQGVLQGRDTLGHHHGESQGLGERGNVP